MNSTTVFNPERKKRLIEADAEMHVAFDEELKWLDDYYEQLQWKKVEAELERRGYGHSRPLG